MLSHLFKFLAVLAITTLIAGCKLIVIVAEGGYVQSSSSGTCLEGSNCVIDITEANFSDTFTAIAQEGYEFSKWNSGGGFLCADGTHPECVVALTGDTLAEAIIALFDARGYIMPVFEFVGIDSDDDGTLDHQDDDDDNDGLADGDDPCPLDDTLSCGTGTEITDIIGIRLNDKEWAQPDLFTNLSWNDLNAACPGGACIEGRVLNGHDMTGWTWASLYDVNDLFTGYVVRPPIVGKRSRSLSSAPWATDFYNDGWRPTLDTAELKAVRGITWSPDEPGFRSTWDMHDYPGDSRNDFCGWGEGIPDADRIFSTAGAWFYRP